MATPRYNFNIGFSPDEWDRLERAADEIGIKKTSIIKAALDNFLKSNAYKSLQIYKKIDE